MQKQISSYVLAYMCLLFFKTIVMFLPCSSFRALANILVRHASEIKSVLKDKISRKLSSELIPIKEQIEHDNPEQVDISASDDKFEVKVHDMASFCHSIVECTRRQSSLFAGNISIDRDTTFFEELIQKMPSE